MFNNDSNFLDAHLGNAHANDDEFSVSPDYEFGHDADSADSTTTRSATPHIRLQSSCLWTIFTRFR
jgi:hypothetical protein